MKMQFNSKKRLIIFVPLLFIGLTITPIIVHINAELEESQSNIETMTFFQEFSKPYIEEDGEYINLNVKEANSWTKRS